MDEPIGGASNVNLLMLEADVRFYANKVKELSKADRDFYEDFIALHRRLKGIGAPSADDSHATAGCHVAIDRLFFEQLGRLKVLEQDIKHLGELGYIVGVDAILENLKKASSDEKMLVLDVLGYFSEYVRSASTESDRVRRSDDIAEQIAEFLQGGQIIFPDGGTWLYDKWSKFEHNRVSRKGASSHQSADEQFAIRGPFVKEALFGTRVCQDGKKHTWLQLESHPTGLRYILGHLISYILYKITGKNIGPYGRSQYTERSPLYLTCEEVDQGQRVVRG